MVSHHAAFDESSFFKASNSQIIDVGSSSSDGGSETTSSIVEEPLKSENHPPIQVDPQKIPNSISSFQRPTFEHRNPCFTSSKLYSQ
ncbi:hypothetical protein L1887_17669 [Cichorium endivia]|nr:hypothetical protein L1887_17669 [Cichorium endivia]